MEISISSLVVEMTRRCNMNCEHCLRGDAQNIDIKNEVLDRIVESVTGIENLTLSGGEPSLNTKGMAYLREAIVKRDLYIGSFFIATNGLDTLKVVDLAREALLLNAYCIECGGEEDMSAIALSTDQYHDPIPEFNENLLRGLSFFSESKMHDHLEDNFLINEGRAMENGLAYQDNESYADIVVSANHAGIEVSSTLYINVHGDVISGCDWSYESQKRVKWGNILEESLDDILIRNATEDLRKIGA